MKKYILTAILVLASAASEKCFAQMRDDVGGEK